MSGNPFRRLPAVLLAALALLSPAPASARSCGQTLPTDSDASKITDDSYCTSCGTKEDCGIVGPCEWRDAGSMEGMGSCHFKGKPSAAPAKPAVDVSTAAGGAQTPGAVPPGGAPSGSAPAAGGQGSAPGEGGAPEAFRPSFRRSALVERGAARWKPFPVRRINGPGEIGTAFTSHVRRIRVKVSDPAAPPPEEGAEPPPPKYEVKYRGVSSALTAQARSYGTNAKDERLLILSFFPASIREKRIHLELRCRVKDEILEAVEFAAVRPRFPGAVPAASRADTMAMRKQGVEFEEFLPASASIQIAHLDARPGGPQAALNAGRILMADFGTRELGTVNLDWHVLGVSGPARR